LGSLISNLNKKSTSKPEVIKAVRIYTIGKSPTVSLEAQIEKKGVIKIVAQGSGIVQTIHVSEGDTVRQGQYLVSLSTNYQGGNAPALQAQLAGAQLQNLNDTYDTQKDIISKQRDIATASAENTDQLRQISQKSLDDTKGLLELNQNLLDSLNTSIAQLEQNGDPQNQLPTLQAQQAQLQSGVDQLHNSVRTLEYQTDTNNPPTLLATTQKDITLEQLDIQEKALDLNKKVSSLQYNLALVQESLMHPAAPFAGTVERINVQVGENVSSGTVIATLASSDQTTTAVVRAPEKIASQISRVQPSILHLPDRSISLTPSYVSTVATDGQLYSILYTLPSGITSPTDGEYISVDVPVGVAMTNGLDPYVPLDSVFESQNESTVFLLQNDKAVARKVQLADVYGQYVSVVQGLHDGDQIILDRNVVAGDRVKPIH
ncbi:MAG TPA: HlyD family efflux transporter periplasmic adaptor subunit, partial [Patescibacteria group bacterium]|nr:HlyD family efflux transporter periplasmic adaptor subunit [Patescibacteria group bacterium]